MKKSHVLKLGKKPFINFFALQLFLFAILHTFPLNFVHLTKRLDRPGLGQACEKFFRCIKVWHKREWSLRPSFKLYEIHPVHGENPTNK